MQRARKQLHNRHKRDRDSAELSSPSCLTIAQHSYHILVAYLLNAGAGQQWTNYLCRRASLLANVPPVSSSLVCMFSPRSTVISIVYLSTLGLCVLLLHEGTAYSFKISRIQIKNENTYLSNVRNKGSIFRNIAISPGSKAGSSDFLLRLVLLPDLRCVISHVNMLYILRLNIEL